MDKSKQEEIILDYLETAYTGARMMEDVEMMCRLSRAITAFNGEDVELKCCCEGYENKRTLEIINMKQKEKKKGTLTLGSLK